MNNSADLIRDFAEFPTHSQVDEIASHGATIVVPLLMAHEKHCDSDHRESIIAVLGRIQEPIMDEIVGYMQMSQHQCARITAFEALEERAIEDKEDLPRVIRFFQICQSDTNSRIQSVAKSSIGLIEQTMTSQPRRCAQCGRISRYIRRDPDTHRSTCGYCRGV